MSKLIVILWDQLSRNIASLHNFDANRDTIVLFEIDEMATAVKHHKKKLVLLWSAMRHFAQSLKESGAAVDYVTRTATGNTQSFLGEIERLANYHNSSQIVITEPSEFNWLDQLQQWNKTTSYPVEIREDTRFLCSKAQFTSWASGKKQLRMEFFYRWMRQHYAILMNGSKPVGGQWNYDSQNRQPADEQLSIPNPFHCEPDLITSTVMTMVEQLYPDHFGDIEPFFFATTRTAALAALKDFIDSRLADFGPYQDAMLQGSPWMYHAHISFYLNCGLLEPMECIQSALTAYHDGMAPLNSVEGFIRQILGWREFIRGIYWLKMPEYQSLNYLEAQAPLPNWYWTGKTKLNCLRQCITETQQNAYAHHIQRLMVLGNFALIAGIHPDEINEWYHIVYMDAYQWVELPNVSGMVLFADAGVVGSKPYAASGAYINKMSNYCQDCCYNVKEKTGKDACPFNYLYWDFLIRNREQLQHNQRMSMIYATLGRMSADRVETIQRDAELFLNDIGQ